MEQGLIRLLKAEEIECRISVINERGLSLLLYKDARVDQRILDETFGVFGWKRSHQCNDGSLYCTVEVKDRETGEWVAKQDVGTTGYAEKEKSQALQSQMPQAVRFLHGKAKPQRTRKRIRRLYLQSSRYPWKQNLSAPASAWRQYGKDTASKKTRRICRKNSMKKL